MAVASDPLTLGVTGNPFDGMPELSAEAVVREVLARNPSLAQMAAAAQAASARYPQVISLDDPMFGVSTAPGAWGSNEVQGGYRLEVAQKFPWPGKLPLRGASTSADAAAAAQEVEDMRLQLVESARNAFYDYYLVSRAIVVNEEGLHLLRDFRQSADNRYTTGLVPQQDVLQADVEIGRQQERLLTLKRMREVAVAKINTLLHLSPDSALPSPPEQLTIGSELPAAIEIRTMALLRRPDLAAATNRLSAEQAKLALALREYKPDVEVAAAYDALWQELPLRTMVGVRVNLPVRLSRRDAAVVEAQSMIRQRQAELARLTDQANFEVQQSYSMVRESEQAIELYRTKLIPAAENNIGAAKSAYVAGKIPFLSLLEAQRNLVELRDRQFEVVVEYFRRRAALDRAAGGPIGNGPSANENRAN